MNISKSYTLSCLQYISNTVIIINYSKLSRGFLSYNIKSILPRKLLIFITLLMPQLLPFYFVNQLSFSFLALGITIYILGSFILPLFNLVSITRMYITKI